MGMVVNPSRFAASGGSQTFSATVTIASGTVGSDLTDFVVLVNLAHMPSGFWSAVKSDGGDVRAYDMSDALIPHDLCMIDTVGQTGRLMVKRSVASGSNTQFKIKCGDSSLSQLAATDTNGRNAVWADYTCVVGFDGTTVDRTGATREEGGSYLSASVNAGFFRFDASSNTYKLWANVTDDFPTLSVYTFGASYYMTAAVGSSNRAILSYRYRTVNTDRQTLVIRDTTNDTISMWNTSDSWLESATPKGASTSTLYRVNGTNNGTTNRKLFFAGALEATDTGTTVRPTAAGIDKAIQIGEGPGSIERFTGEIGFVYLRSGELSAHWLAAEYLSWHNPGSFYSIS